MLFLQSYLKTVSQESLFLVQWGYDYGQRKVIIAIDHTTNHTKNIVESMGLSLSLQSKKILPGKAVSHVLKSIPSMEWIITCHVEVKIRTKTKCTMAAVVLPRLPKQPTHGSKGSNHQIEATVAKNDFDCGCGKRW